MATKRPRNALDDWPRPLLLGHRGSRQRLPENSLQALDSARHQGVHGFEIDVRLSAGGTVVVFHDATLTRLTHGKDTRAIAELSDAQIEAVDLGAGARIPKLAEVLDYCRQHQLLLDVEIKHDVPSRRQLVAQTAACLRDACDGTVMMSSFDPRIIAAFKRQLPRMPRALIIGERSTRLQLHRLQPLLATSAICVDHNCITSRNWSRWARAAHVFSWTVNTRERVAELLALGVSGIISDVPDIVAPAMAGVAPAAHTASAR